MTWRLVAAAVVATACATAAEHAEPAGAAPEPVERTGTPAARDEVTGGDFTTTQEPALPAGSETARQRLDASPRHGEWAMVPVGGADSIRAFVVYPERSGPAPVVLVVHEIYGVTAWIRAVADQLAAEGFIAIAPDLLTGLGVPTGEDGDPVRDAATAAVRALQPERYQRQLTEIGRWGMALPAAARRYGIVGFCWGGSAAFAHAAMSPDVSAAVVYYGSSPAADRLQQVRAPVLGLYAGDDERVNATVPPARTELERLGRAYAVHMFDGAGHGFLRQQQGRDGANMAATRAAWPLTLAFFREHLER
jgi:carboxymethylenebutenolidase